MMDIKKNGLEKWVIVTVLSALLVSAIIGLVALSGDVQVNAECIRTNREMIEDVNTAQSEMRKALENGLDGIKQTVHRIDKRQAVILDKVMNGGHR